MDRPHDCLGHLILDGEDVLQLAVVPLRPDVLVFDGVDQLRGDPDARAGPAHRSLDHIAHAELLADLFQVHGIGTEGE